MINKNTMKLIKETVRDYTNEHIDKTDKMQITADGIIAFCPDSMDSEFECPRKTRDNIDPICGECRREYWLEEVKDDEH